MRDDPAERPDFVIHSYTKDLSGTGSVIAGVVIGRNEDMFLPKGETAGGVAWNETLFWNVYYVKGAFLELPTPRSKCCKDCGRWKCGCWPSASTR